MTIRTAACVVVFDRQVLGEFLARSVELSGSLGPSCEWIVVLMQSSGLSTDDVRRACSEAGISASHLLKSDDSFFDWSAYLLATRIAIERGVEGVLFVNDTLATRHTSSYLRARMRATIAEVVRRPLPFAVLVGPYSNSEFSAGPGPNSEFVSTFLFYLNRPGLRILLELLELMPAVFEVIRARGEGSFGKHPFEESVLRICDLHRSYIRPRYRARPDGDIRSAQKLTTVYCERMLSAQVKDAGAIWFVAGGLLGRLMVPVQRYWGRMLLRLRGKDI